MLTSQNQVQGIMKMLIDSELAVAAFFTECAKAWKEESVFWKQLADKEKHHADLIRSMARIMADNPERFLFDRPLNTVTLQNFIEGIRNGINRLKNGELTRQNMLLSARDYTRNLIETRYADIIKSTDPTFNEQLETLLKESENHKKTLDLKISAWPG